MLGQMTFTAMLLVGGESRRMGTDKATLMVAGERLWQRQLRLLRELEPQRLWVSARTRPAWCPGEIEVVLDEQPSRGPLSGIAAALSRLQTSHLFALAIDMPQMTGGHVKKLLGLLEPGCGVVPVNGELFEPLCAVYPCEASVIASHALGQGQLSLQQLVRILREKNCIKRYCVADEEQCLYHNANAPA
ncbi:MAG TPA: molybdenum cofactor guanylyltransferase [Candidatus Binatia bacterium]|jgi:molybdopterin-guanine dinucleotide biosynthesis protein A|nr:molybdenum cofactor guanylyltransferase [Candidatus Binatia bacterium]